MRTAPLHTAAPLFADTARGRLLFLLEGRELMVSELCAAVALPQSTVSRHLAALGELGFVDARRDGTRHFYRYRTNGRPPALDRFWELLRGEVEAMDEARRDRDRLERTLARRNERSERYFAAAAERWDGRRDELYGQRFDLGALAGLLEPAWVVADLACGTGRMTAALAPFVARVVAIDSSTEMLAAARRRLAGVGNVELREGRLESLPLPARSLDLAVVVLALHLLPDLAVALQEIRRTLRPSGRLLVVDLAPHDRDDLREEMGHLSSGFAAEDVTTALLGAGFSAVRVTSLPPDPSASGPSLFAAVAALSRNPQPADRRRGSKIETKRRLK